MASGRRILSGLVGKLSSVCLFVYSVTLVLALTGCGSYGALKKDVASLKELRTRNLVLQKHEYTCGAAAMATTMNVLSGVDYTERDILMSLRDTVVRKKGKYPALSVAHLIKAAKVHGFKVVTFKSFEGDISRQVIKSLHPLIVRLKLEDDYGHFVVVRGVKRGWVYVSDPAYGNFRLTWEDFYHFWEKGDRVFLTVSQKRFIGWRDESGTLHVSRSESEKVPAPKTIAPITLYESNMRSLSMVNSLTR